MRRFEVSAIVGALVLALTTSDLAAQDTHFCLVEDEAFVTANGGCQDLATGLVWSRRNPSGGANWHWDQAVQICEDLGEGGFTDWRLATIAELETVHANGAPTHFDYPIFRDTNWSSTRQGNKAWFIRLMTSGATAKLIISGFGAVSCVRDPSVCGNATCEPGENQCNCPGDCGSPSATESDCADGADNDCDGDVDCFDTDCAADPACACTADETSCSDGLDNDCDGDIDCDDADCTGDPDCDCLPEGASCFADEECCSDRCRNGRFPGLHCK